MAIRFNNFIDKNPNIEIIEQGGCFTVFCHKQDLSVSPGEANMKYFMKEMNCKPRQVLVAFNGSNSIKLAKGAMQMMFGNVESVTGIQGAGDLIGKMVKSKMTGDSAVKPVYRGMGYMMTEPTYRFPIIEDLSEWGSGLVCDDRMFLACDGTVQDNVQMRSNISSAVAGGEGLFNLYLQGQGFVVLNSRVPRNELYEIELDNDVVKIDGNNAVCWTGSLNFTVERSSKTLIGSAVNGEGLVNVYRGSGRILVEPLKDKF